jgi:hypothetical protein
MTEIQQLRKTIADALERLEELELAQATNNAPAKWGPKGGDYYIEIDGCVNHSTTINSSREFGIERETEEQAGRAAEWMRKFNRLMCWFEENAPGHEINIAFNTDSVDICFFALPEVIDNIRIQVRDGVVEL